MRVFLSTTIRCACFVQVVVNEAVQESLEEPAMIRQRLVVRTRRAEGTETAHRRLRAAVFREASAEGFAVIKTRYGFHAHARHDDRPSCRCLATRPQRPRLHGDLPANEKSGDIGVVAAFGRVRGSRTAMGLGLSRSGQTRPASRGPSQRWGHRSYSGQCGCRPPSRPL